MTIYTANTNSTPQDQYGALYRAQDTSAYYVEEARVPGTTMYYDQSGQVVGLVPVFPCCNREATGELSWTMVVSSTNSVFTITLPTGTTSQFTINGLDTAAIIEATIEAILPAGYQCSVSSTANGGAVDIVVIIYAPTGTGTNYNGLDCILNRISGTEIYNSQNFSGGYDESGCDCREGDYGGDALPDTSQFPLPVFAEFEPDANYDRYKNDFNSFLFECAAVTSSNTYTFFLDQLQNGTYVEIATLSDNTYGRYYNTSTLCTNLLWKGYQINWSLVLQAFGEGRYKFRMMTNLFSRKPKCWSSPPFCLEIWDCNAVERTTKFQAYYSGGTFGSIEKADCGNKFWQFCCKQQIDGLQRKTSSISWEDSIRIEGFFGYEDKQIERRFNKYQTGTVVKIRDEAIRKFRWKSGKLPFWFHDRFAVYGLMADKLIVSDYNLNNSDYGLKTYCVVADSDYAPKYTGASRYSKVDLDFKAQNQYLIRTRCC